jgi:glycerol-3-phosphate cytidylyltransferase
VIPEESWEQKIADINNYNVDVFAIGKDWEGKFDFLKEYCEVIYLERTIGISTKKLKKSIERYLSVPREDIMRAFDIIDRLKKDLQ